MTVATGFADGGAAVNMFTDHQIFERYQAKLRKRPVRTIC